ncbi:MAG: XdhC family protein [Acidobacteriota bacterium]
MPDFFRTLLDLAERGQGFITATVVNSTGSTPGKMGHRMIVLPDRSIHFTIGGGPLEAMVIEDCLEQFRLRRNAVKTYRLLPEGKGAVGMVCGGVARVFIEVHPPRPALLVFGAGHVGTAIMNLGRGMGFQMCLADDRKEFLDPARFSHPVRLVHCPDGYAGPLPETDPETFVAIVTRCHQTDREILMRLADRPLAYLGMIGSPRKVEVVIRELEARGLDRTALSHLRAPMGLPIGSRRPCEIALSVLAEMIAVRNGATIALERPRGRRASRSRA